VWHLPQEQYVFLAVRVAMVQLHFQHKGGVFKSPVVDLPAFQVGPYPWKLLVVDEEVES
jgi:hypothetical protein